MRKVMTDKACEGCDAPLMRTPETTKFHEVICVNCETQRDSGAAGDVVQPVGNDLTTRPGSSSGGSNNDTPDEAGRSTPPTDPSFTPGSPSLLLPPETDEVIQRRAQSDQASAEIGRRLLQGWAMLADECPNASCYGVPLVRPPRARDGARSQEKECVICSTVYSVEKGNSRGPPSPSATRESLLIGQPYDRQCSDGSRSLATSHLPIDDRSKQIQACILNTRSPQSSLLTSALRTPTPGYQRILER